MIFQLGTCAARVIWKQWDVTTSSEKNIMEWVFFLGEPYMCRWKREMKKEVSTLLILYKEHKLLFSLLIN